MITWLWLACGEPCERAWYADLDGDGHGDPDDVRRACAPPQAYVASSGDCDDADRDRHPDAAELCNLVDDDCDGAVDEDVAPRTLHLDVDRDGFGSAVSWTGCGASPPNYTAPAGGDCDDLDPAVHPGVAEICDGIDQDCDGVVDNAAGARRLIDRDGDGYGDQELEAGCPDVSNPVLLGDCDDSDDRVYPFAPERCNQRDDDCDTFVDEDPVDGVVAWIDGDDDGWGTDEAVPACPGDEFAWIERISCPYLYGYYGYYGNVYTSNYGYYFEYVYDTCLTYWESIYPDFDPDRIYGPRYAYVIAAPVADRSGDCDDAVWLVSPSRTEHCNGFDDNCDGRIDDADPNVSQLFQFPYYLDVDNDGYGDDSTEIRACVEPPSFAAVGGDCDDRDRFVSPAAAELCNGVDDDCDGVVDPAPVCDGAE